MFILVWAVIWFVAAYWMQSWYNFEYLCELRPFVSHSSNTNFIFSMLDDFCRICTNIY
jgi:hypothetical protein